MMKTSIVFLLCLLVIGFACKKDIHSTSTVAFTPQLSVDQTALNFADTAGSTSSFNITTNDRWNLAGLPSWAKASTSTGLGDQTVTITTTAINPFITAQTTTANITGSVGSNIHKTITLTQAPGPTTLSTDSSALNFASANNSLDSFNITSNAPWTITSIPAWANASVSSGTGNQFIIVNTTSAAIVPRSGMLIIKATGYFDTKSDTIMLNQQ